MFEVVFDLKMGQVFKNGSSKICRRQPLKNFNGYWLLKVDRSPSVFLTGCLPQILLGPVLNKLSQISLITPRMNGASQTEVRHIWIRYWNTLTSPCKSATTLT